MAEESHLNILTQGVEAWNSWREQDEFEIWPNLSGGDLSGKDLSGADLSRVDFSGTDLSGTNLSGAYLSEADLSEAMNLSEAILHTADLSEADLPGADLYGADLSGARLYNANLSGANLTRANLSDANLYMADLSWAELSGWHLPTKDLYTANLPIKYLHPANLTRTDLSRANFTRAYLAGVNFIETKFHGANLTGAYLYGADLTSACLSGAKLSGSDLSEANFSGADLSGADLTRCRLVKTNFEGTVLTDCRVYGISAWDLRLDKARQWNLHISDEDEPTIKVDNLEVAQFIYLLLNNQNIRQVIDTITSKVVLILGRFSVPRKALLEAIRQDLRQRGYLPVLFDFDKPASRGLTETVSTLAHLSRFIIADITDAKSIPQELQAIVPNLPSVPVQPLLLTSDREYGMFRDFRQYPWVLDTYYYDNATEVLTAIKDKIITPAETKARELSQ